jgi:hypothetical protein
MSSQRSNLILLLLLLAPYRQVAEEMRGAAANTQGRAIQSKTKLTPSPKVGATTPPPTVKPSQKPSLVPTFPPLVAPTFQPFLPPGDGNCCVPPTFIPVLAPTFTPFPPPTYIPVVAPTFPPFVPPSPFVPPTLPPFLSPPSTSFPTTTPFPPVPWNQTQIGNTIPGNTTLSFGDSMALSFDGTTIAVTAPNYADSTGLTIGQTVVYSMNKHKKWIKSGTFSGGASVAAPYTPSIQFSLPAFSPITGIRYFYDHHKHI